MNNNLSILSHIDPASISYPPALPLEIALGADLDELKVAYGITEEEWEALKLNENFRKDILKHQEEVKEEGYSYRKKAKVQAENLLTTSWELIHDKDTPPAVKADLIKFTARVAGYDTQGKGPAAGEAQPTFSININMGGNRNAPAQVSADSDHPYLTIDNEY